MPRFKNSWSIGYGVTINDKHSFGTYKLILTNNDVNETPTPKTSYVSVPGSSKVIDLSDVISGKPVYDQRKLKFEFAAGNDPETWPARYSKFLNNVHGKRVKLILDNDNLWYYEGRADVHGFNRRSEIGTFKMEVTCDPFKKFLYGIGEPWHWDDFMFGGIGWLIYVVYAASVDEEYAFDHPFTFQSNISDSLDLNSNGSLDISDARKHIRIERGLDPAPENKTSHPNKDGMGQYQSNVIMQYDRQYRPLAQIDDTNPYKNGYFINKENGAITATQDQTNAGQYHVRFYDLSTLSGKTLYISGTVKGRASLYAIGTGTNIGDFTPVRWDNISGKRDKEHNFSYRISVGDNDTMLALGYYGSTGPKIGTEICPAYIDYKKDTDPDASPTQRDVYCTYYEFSNSGGATTGYSVHGIDISGATASYPVDVKIFSPYDNILNFYSDEELQEEREYFDNDGLLLSPTLPEFIFTATNRETDRIVVQKVIEDEVVAGENYEFIMSIPSDSDTYSLKFAWPEFVLGNDDNIMVGHSARHSRYITLRFWGTGNVKIRYTPQMI